MMTEDLSVLLLTQYWLKPFTDVAYSSTTDTMSSQLTTLIAIFDGQNYGNWSKAMHAFLMAQGLWGFADGTNQKPATPVLPIPPAPSQKQIDGYKVTESIYNTAKAEYDCDFPAHPALLAAWQKGNDMTLGNMTLCLSTAIQQRMDPLHDTEDTWDWLRDTFGAASIPSVYCDLKEAISMRINPNQHPGPQFDKLSAAFGRISAISIGSGSTTRRMEVQTKLQALIAMVAIPAKWENLIPIICNSNEIDDLNIGSVREVIVTQYENETNWGAHKSGSQANKLSAVKWKHGDPHFNKQGSQQQSQPTPSPLNQQQHRQRGTRGTGKGGKPPSKGKAKAKGQSHVTLMAIHEPVFTTDAALPSPTSLTIAHFGPSSSKVTWTITQLPPTQWVDGAYPSVNKTLMLLERLEVTPSIQTAKNIEECFLKIDKEMRARAGFYEGDSELDEDMLWSGPGWQVYTYIPDDLEDISGEDLLQQFEVLSIDNNSLGLYEEPQRAPTPEYVSPQSATADLGHDQFIDLEAEIDEEWKSKNLGPLKCKTSNEVIEEAWKNHKDYVAVLNRAPTPRLPSDFDDGLEDALDWGSDEELKYASTSFYTLDTNTLTVLVLRFAKRCPTWTMIMWMQPLTTQLWSSDTRYSNTRSPL
jgi:hypothetical protein